MSHEEVLPNSFGEGKIEEFKKACYYYISGTHETPYVKVEWGKTLLKHKKSDFKYITTKE